MFGYSSKSQVIVDHSYLGPMCLQLTNPSSVADVKREIMERTGLPERNQHLYCNGKKVSVIKEISLWRKQSFN